VGFIKNTLAEVAPHFTTARMIRDYQDRYYNPQFERTQKVVNDDFKLAKELADWKIKVSSKWNDIEVKNIEFSDGITNKMVIGQEYPVYITVDLKELSSNEIGVELMITENGTDKPAKIVEILEFNAESCEGSVCTYTNKIKPNHPGAFNYSFRLFAKNENLPHRQDFKYIRWI